MRLPLKKPVCMSSRHWSNSPAYFFSKTATVRGECLASIRNLGKTGYQPDQVVTTLENKMKCGIGHCGRCYVGPFSVCKDGPVVTWAELNELPKDY